LTRVKIPIPREGRGEYATVFLCLALTLLVGVFALWRAAGTGIAYPDPDDIMRLQQVRDWLGGQSWFDTTQYRLVPVQAPMHWSRLVDLPIAALILLFSFVLSNDQAEFAATRLWPLLLVLPLLMASGVIGRTLANRGGEILAILGAASLALLIPWFAPGRIDHHNLQTVLALTLLAGLCLRSRSGMQRAGLASACMLTIGMETLPLVVVGAGAACFLLWRENRRPDLFCAWLFSFALGMLGLFVLTVPPHDMLRTSCDTMSLVFLAPLLLASGMALLAFRLKAQRRVWRGLPVAMGMTSLACVAFLNPACLCGPYAEIEPDIVSLWMNHIREARGIISLFREDASAALAVLVLPLLALIGNLWQMREAQARYRAGLGVAVFTILLGLAFWQVRVLPLAAFLAVPVWAAWVANRLWTGRGQDMSLPHSRVSRTLAVTFAVFVANPLFLVALASSLGRVLSAPASQTRPELCTRGIEYEALAREAPGRVLTHIAMGPYVLGYTAHEVLAAPYHRHEKGLLTALTILRAAPQDAFALMEQHGITHLALCREDTALTPISDAFAFGQRVQTGEIFPFLEPLPQMPGEPVKPGEPLKPVQTVQAFRIRRM
jgi:hypothetical protein